MEAGASGEEIERVVTRAIEARNVAGLADPRQGNLYPADVEVAAKRAGLVGATAEEVREALTTSWLLPMPGSQELQG